MTDAPPQPKPPPSPTPAPDGPEREARLAAALRANLRRRKQGSAGKGQTGD